MKASQSGHKNGATKGAVAKPGPAAGYSVM